MKKRLLILLLLFIMALPAIGSCLSPIMQVNGVEEWVSMRKAPKASSTRIKRIPLGELVFKCTYANSLYTYCEYDNTKGYVLTQYLVDTDLTPAPTATPTAAPIATPAPSPTATAARPNKSGLWGLATQKLATRSGPSTTYEDKGTYNMKGKWVRVYCRAWDKRNGIWWVKVGIPYHGETRILWTGYKRFDKNSLPLHSIPIGK